MFINRISAVMLLFSLVLLSCGKSKEATDQADSKNLPKLTANQITISRWGPQLIEIEDKSIRRKNGDLGVWFEQKGISMAQDIEIWFGQEKINNPHYVKPNEVVTLDIPAKLVSAPGKTRLFLKLPSSGQEVEIGIVEVKERPKK